MEYNRENWPEKKRDIIDAAVSVTADVGLARTTTALIAKKAKVGEGTIYRHFKSKDEILLTAAHLTSDKLFAKPRKTYNPDLPVQSQYLNFCESFLRSAEQIKEHHVFMEQFIDSPQGVAYRKQFAWKMESGQISRGLGYPLDIILCHGLQQGLLKDSPMIILVGLTLAPLTFMLKHADQGFFKFDDDNIAMICNSCWSAISK